jgi:hypothetical protein
MTTTPHQQSLIKHEDPSEVVVHPSSVLDIIAQAARDPAVDVAKLTALLELKERIDRLDAEKEFNQAFSQLQLKLPRVKKNGTIELGGKGKIAFAKWEDVMEVLQPFLTTYGFSLSFTSQPVPSGVLMTCALTHQAGHSRQSVVQLPPDNGPGRNALQAIRSSSSYGKRGLTLDILNIVTEGADDDAHRAFPLTADQLNNVRNMVDACELKGNILKAFLNFAEAGSVETIQQRDYDRVMEALRKKFEQKQKGPQ